MPQAATDPQGQMIDFQGNPLPSDKQARVIQLQKQGTQAYRELEATYSPEQEKKNEEVKDIMYKIYEILGAPKDKLDKAKEEDKQAQQAQKARQGHRHRRHNLPDWINPKGGYT